MRSSAAVGVPKMVPGANAGWGASSFLAASAGSDPPAPPSPLRSACGGAGSPWKRPCAASGRPFNHSSRVVGAAAPFLFAIGHFPVNGQSRRLRSPSAIVTRVTFGGKSVMVVGDGETVFPNGRDQASEGHRSGRQRGGCQITVQCSRFSPQFAPVRRPDRALPTHRREPSMGSQPAASAAGVEDLRASNAANWISRRLMSISACNCSGAIGLGASRCSHQRRSRFSMSSLP